MILSSSVRDRVETAKKALGARERGERGEGPGPGTHIQVVGEDHGGGAVAKGEPLGGWAPLSTEPGHVHASLPQAFPD